MTCSSQMQTTKPTAHLRYLRIRYPVWATSGCAAIPVLAKDSGESKGARAGSKSEEVIAMLKRKGGATLAEIMEHTGWQKHTTRGWVSGYLGKKLGLAVESFKSDKGDRTYRIK